MRTCMEYEEIEVPEEIQNRLEQLAQMQSQEKEHRPTLGNAGFFDWLNKRSREDGWRIVWHGFNFPYVVFEREVELEEAQN